MEDQQRQHVIKRKWSYNLSLLLLSLAGHTFVNKYVLSVLKFQYPTVFISWQCCSCAILLMSAYALGYLNLAHIDSSLLRVWSPYMVLHTGIMYSGSVSLSKLAIPVFLGLQNLTYVFKEFLTHLELKKLPSVNVLISLLFVGLGALCLFYSDLNRDPLAYKWALVYVTCSALYAVYSEIDKDVKLSNLDKAYCNSLFSVVSLTFISILTGEWRKTMDFPFLYYIRFHIGCLCSGVLYGLTAVFHNSLARDTSSKMTEAGKSLNKALFSLLSFGIFETSLDSSVTLSVSMLLIGGMVYTYLKLKESTVETDDLASVRNH